jgi:lipoprotein-anchoring transpeptidase ErfK/SrfK
VSWVLGQRVGGSMGVRRGWGVAAVAATIVLVLGGCSSGSGHGAQHPSAVGNTGASGHPGTPDQAPAPPAKLSVSPANGAENVGPDDPVSVAVADGTLSSVTMTSPTGKVVKGALNADKTSWQVAEALGYSKTYTVLAKARNAAGEAVQRAAHFTTVTPPNMTMPYLNSTGGNAIRNGATYGVGFVVNVHFDEPISDRAAAESTLSVTTSPAQPGGWYWMDNQNVHWRPRTYYTPGTKVRVAAQVYGQQVSPGLWGQADTSVSFKIGPSHVSVADDKTKIITVYQNGRPIKRMPTSMGKGGKQVVKGKTITFWTQAGTYTVLDQGNPVRMDSRTFGLSLDAGGYNELVYYATRISTDGIYVHSAPWSVWAQGNTDTSHGCLNVSPQNAQWFYKWSQIGDVVQVRHTGGTPLEVWQNGDWGVPWAQWEAGSALH